MAYYFRIKERSGPPAIGGLIALGIISVLCAILYYFMEVRGY
jgi:hypothetical protein